MPWLFLLIVASWLAPIDGAGVEREFSAPTDAWSAGHRGIDYSAEPGSPVTAIGPGRVHFVGTVGGKPVVTVDHPDLGLRSTYEPVDTSVTKGQAVAAGDVLGVTAAAGGHCAGHCLHLGVKVIATGAYRDPIDLLGTHAAILKPVAAYS